MRLTPSPNEKLAMAKAPTPSGSKGLWQGLWDPRTQCWDSRPAPTPRAGFSSCQSVVPAVTPRGLDGRRNGAHLPHSTVERVKARVWGAPSDPFTPIWQKWTS